MGLSYTEEEIRAIMPDGELANLSAEFWSQAASRLKDVTCEDNLYKELLAFQNGYLYCKQYYKIDD